jgi:hypothetical protein
MSNSNGLAVSELESRLRIVEEDFDREMRIRGFDPAQDDNVALPGPLAKLYAEREDLREKLRSCANGKVSHSRNEGN